MIARASESQEHKLLVEFGGVSIGDGTARIGIVVSRDSRPLTEFDEFFCERRLTGSIHVTKNNEDPDQRKLFEQDGPVQLESVFDVKGFSVKTKKVSAGLTFALREIDSSLLAKFAKQTGYLVITEVGFIPENEKDDDHVDVNESEFLKSTDDDSEDAWKLAPIAELKLAKGKVAKLASIGVETMGELEDLRAGTNKQFRRGLIDVDGFGQAAVDDVEDRVLAWLDKNRDKWAQSSDGASAEPEQIRLKRSVRGYANKAAGLYKDAVLDVLKWKNGTPTVQTLDGQKVKLESRDWEPATLTVA